MYRDESGLALRALVGGGRRSRDVTQHAVGGSDSDTKEKEYFVLLYTSLFSHQRSERWQQSLRPIQGVPFTMTRHKKKVGPRCASLHVYAAMSLSLH
jgi:hypothetical protein